MLIPEVVIHNVISSAFAAVIDDWNLYTDKTRTILHEVFNKDDNGDVMKIGKFNYLEQAKSIFLKTNNNVRHIEITMGYNLERAALPTIHIILPSESKGENSIGMGEGYNDYDMDDINNQYKETYNYTKQVTYNLLITSDNSSEVILIYHFLNYILVSLKNHIELSGLRNISFGGNDLNFQNELVPTTIFHRSLLFSFYYENRVTDFFYKAYVKSLTAKGVPEEDMKVVGDDEITVTTTV